MLLAFVASSIYVMASPVLLAYAIAWARGATEDSRNSSSRNCGTLPIHVA